MTLDFLNVRAILSDSQPPEITHFQKGSHPGRGWWLKTAVPLVGVPDLYQIWRSLSKQHSNLICLTQDTYNWNQQIVNNVISIWLRESIDVELTVGDGTYNYSMVPFENSFNLAGKNLEKQLLNFQKQNPAAVGKDELHYLLAVVQLMSTWHTDTQANCRRAKIQVVNNEESVCNANQSTKLDSI
jgi:hypothetical protein